MLYLSDGLCYTEAGQPVYVAQEEEQQEEEVVGRTEVQSAILSIVETGTDTSSEWALKTINVERKYGDFNLKN